MENIFEKFHCFCLLLNLCTFLTTFSKPNYDICLTCIKYNSDYNLTCSKSLLC